MILFCEAKLNYFLHSAKQIAIINDKYIVFCHIFFQIVEVGSVLFLDKYILCNSSKESKPF